MLIQVDWVLVVRLAWLCGTGFWLGFCELGLDLGLVDQRGFGWVWLFGFFYG